MPDPDNHRAVFITIFVTGPIASGKSRAVHAMLEGLKQQFNLSHRSKVQEELGLEQHQLSAYLKDEPHA